MFQRRALGAIAVAVLASTVTACGFDSPAVTEHERNSVQAQEFKVGPVSVGDVFVTSHTGFTGKVKTYVVFTMVNDGTGPDQLTSITTPAGPVSLSGSGVFGGSLTVPNRGTPVQVGTDPTGSVAKLAPSSAPQEGSYIPMQFTFANAGASQVEQVPVIPDVETTAPSSPVPTTPAPIPSESGVPVIE